MYIYIICIAPINAATPKKPTNGCNIAYDVLHVTLDSYPISTLFCNALNALSALSAFSRALASDPANHLAHL